MAVNRFDKAAEAAFINTYAPIDFEALYQIGAANNAAVEKAQKELSTNLANWAEFQSHSVIDTENFFKMSYGQVKDLIEAAVLDPDLMKDSAFRAKLTGRLNSLDIAGMSKLKKNATNFDIRAAKIADLKSKDLYAQWMDEIDMANWDTLGMKGDAQGMMTDLSPIAYKSLEELAQPYTKDLESTYYGGNKNPITGEKRDWTSGWMAITKDDVARSLRFGEIINTPQGAAWFKRYQQLNPNKTSDEVARIMFNDLVTTQSDKIRTVPIDDKFGFEAWKYKQEHGDGNNPSSQYVPTRIGEYQIAAEAKYMEFVDKVKETLVNNGTIKPSKDGKLSQEDEKNLLGNVAALIKQNPSLRKDISTAFIPSEYYKMFGVDKNNALSLTTKNGTNYSNRYATMEKYSYRPDDVVFTTDGHILSDPPKAIFIDVPRSSTVYPTYPALTYDHKLAKETKQLDGSEIYYKINEILRNLGELEVGSAFNAGESATKYGYLTGNSFDNRLLVDGQLIVSKSILKEVIEDTYPEAADDILAVFMRGFRESKDDKNPSHKIMTKLNTKDAYLEGFDDLYKINLGRGFDTQLALGNEFNTQINKDRYGVSYTSKTIAPVLGKTLQQTQDTSGSSFDEDDK